MKWGFLLKNLIDNAFHDATQVDFTAICQQKNIVITIEDNGPGIPKTERENVFKPFVFIGNSNINITYWLGVGGNNHEYHGTTNGDNSLGQEYINIGFVTMIPSIYEQLCSIYEKHDVVADDKFGKNFIVEFILNLTRYYQDSDDKGKPTGDPTLIPPYNNIGPFDDNNPRGKDKPHREEELYSFSNLTLINPNCFNPYEKKVIHIDDIGFDIKNILKSDIELKQELDREIRENIGKRRRKSRIRKSDEYNVFTVNDYFAHMLIIVSGLTFNDKDNERDKNRFLELFSVQGDVGRGVNHGTTGPHVNSDATPVKTTAVNMAKVNNTITPLNKDNIKTTGLGIGKTNPTGGKIIKNKKTRRRMGRTRHKKHHKTNKKHKKHQTSCKNKTRKSKKAKRKNKTR